MGAASRLEIHQWFSHGVAEGLGYMLIVTDEFDHDDYPVFVRKAEDVKPELLRLEQSSMQAVREVYDLRKDRLEQMQQPRVWNVPPAPAEPKKLFTVAVSSDGSQVLLMTPEKDRIFHREDILPDLDGNDVAVKTAAEKAVRNYLGEL